jgi:cytochrome c oxidase subunit 2
VIGLVAGCGGPVAALAPAGPQAGQIASLWWFYAVITGTVFLLVMVFLAAALLRRRDPAPVADARLHRGIAAATGATAVLVFVLLVGSIVVGGKVAALPTEDALPIEVVGYQWWWGVTYTNADPSQQVTAANEIHVPVGRPVVLTLLARDVIHSFWVPELHGKMDLIPSRLNTLSLRVDHPGVYRGRCAEFCGAQHAHMGFLVVAEEPDAFARWLDAQRSPSVPPDTDQERRGQELFVRGPCASCHAIAGTEAAATRGPDLTHFASRETLGAATLPNVTGHIAGWITDNQSIKPGNHMPDILLPPDDLLALTAYLESLK